MDELSGCFGHSWSTVQSQEVAVTVGDGVQSSHVRWAATVGESPDLEVIQAQQGIWSVEHNNGQALHHIAYWSDDLDADIERLTTQGHRLEASGTDTDGR